jgi:hypothetical protein
VSFSEFEKSPTCGARLSVAKPPRAAPGLAARGGTAAGPRHKGTRRPAVSDRPTVPRRPASTARCPTSRPPRAAPPPPRAVRPADRPAPPARRLHRALSEAPTGPRLPRLPRAASTAPLSGAAPPHRLRAPASSAPPRRRWRRAHRRARAVLASPFARPTAPTSAAFAHHHPAPWPAPSSSHRPSPASPFGHHENQLERRLREELAAGAGCRARLLVAVFFVRHRRLLGLAPEDELMVTPMSAMPTASPAPPGPQRSSWGTIRRSASTRPSCVRS